VAPMPRLWLGARAYTDAFGTGQVESPLA
jgi:hypothetical protein